MALEDMINDMKKFEMLKSESKESKDYTKRVEYLTGKIEKLGLDMKNLNKIIASQNNKLGQASKNIPDLEQKLKKINEAYESQIKTLKRLNEQAGNRKKSKKNKENIKNQEEELNKTLEKRIKIQTKLNNITSKRDTIKTRVGNAKTRLEKQEIDMKAFQKQQEAMKNINLAGEKILAPKKKTGTFGKGILDFARNLSTAMFAAQTLLAPIGMLIGSLGELEKKVTTLGVVSGKSIEEIRGLRSQLLKMSTQSIYSAKQLSDSLEQIVRTGKTIEQAQDIVSKTVNLATASFESLSFATMTVNKAMVALGLQSEDAGRVVNTFHNIVLSTPLDLRTLDESLRQTASAFGTIIKFSGKSGDNLEEYKLNVLSTVSALTGAMSLLGKTGSQSGTSLKMFGTKLLAMGSAASNMLDKEMKTKNVKLSKAAMTALGMSDEDMEKTVSVSTSNLTKLVKTDLDAALNEISNLYRKGQLSFNTLAKMFGQRNVGQIASMLSMLGGDIGTFKRELLSTRDVSKDAAVAMESWAASLEKLNNSFTRAEGSFSNFLDTTGKDMLDFTSKLLNRISDLSESSPGAISGLTSGMLTYVGVSTLANKKSKQIKAAIAGIKAEAATTGSVVSAVGNRILGMFTPWGIALTAISVGVAMVVHRYKKLEQAEKERLETARRADKEMRQSLDTVYYANETRRRLLDGIDLQIQNEIKNWGRLTDVIEVTDETMRKFYGSLDVSKLDMDLSKLFKIDKGETYESTANYSYLKQQEKTVKNLRTQDNVDAKLLKTEERKLEIAIQLNKQQKSGNLSYLKFLRARTAHEKKTEISKLTKRDFQNNKASQKDVNKAETDRIISGKNEEVALKEFKTNMPAKMRAAIENGYITIEEALNDTKMSYEELSTKYKNKFDDLTKEMVHQQSYVGEGPAHDAFKMKTGLEAYINEHNKIAEYSSDYNSVVEETLTLENKDMMNRTEAYNKANAKFAEAKQTLQGNIFKYDKTLLNKKNIGNIEDFKKAIDSIYGKKATEDIMDAFNKADYSEEDVLQALDGGKNLDTIKKIKSKTEFAKNVQNTIDSSFKELMNIKLKNPKSIHDVTLIKKMGQSFSVDDSVDVKTKKINELTGKVKNKDTSSLIQSYKENIVQAKTKQESNSMINDLIKKIQSQEVKTLIESSKEAFLTAETNKEREIIQKNLIDNVEGTKRAKTNASYLFDLFTKYSGLLDFAYKEQKTYIKMKLALQEKELSISEFQIKQSLKERSDYLTALGATNDESIKNNLEIKNIAREKKIVEKKNLLTSIQMEKIGRETYKHAQSTEMSKQYKELDIDTNKGYEIFAQQLKDKFRNSKDEDFKLIGSKTSTKLTIDVNKYNAAINRAIESELESIRLNNKELELQRERNKISEKINFDMYDYSGRVAKLKIQENRAQIGTDVLGYKGTDKNQELEIDKNILAEKIEYLKTQTQDTEMKKRIAKLQLDKYEVELEQYNVRRQSIKEVANSSLESLVTSATTGEIPKVDNSKLMSGFGDLMGSIFGGSAPSLDVEHEQLSKLGEIADNTRIGKNAISKTNSTGGERPKGVLGQIISKSLFSNDFKEKFSGAQGIGAKFGVLKGGIGASFKNFSSRWKGTAKKGNFSKMDKAGMIAQGVGATVGVLNTFSQAQAKSRVDQAKAEGEILQMRLQGAHTEKEKKDLEDQIFENKKRQIRAQYKAKTNFMGMSGTTGAAVGGAVNGAMKGAATGGAPGAVVGGVTGLISGWMSGNKAKQQMKQQIAQLKVQRDIKKLNEDRNKMLKANNTFMGTYGKYAGKIGINEGIKAGFKSIKDVGTMAVGGSGADVWSQSHGHGKKKYRTQESVQRTVGLKDIGMTRGNFESMSQTLTAIERTKAKITQWSKKGTHEANATSKAYKNMLKNLQNIADVHKSNVDIYKSYFGAKLEEKKDGDYITGFSANWNDFRSEMLKMSSNQALAGMDAKVNKLTNNFFGGVSDAFVQNMTNLNKVISENIITAYDKIANALEGKTIIDQNTLIGPMTDLIIGIKKYKDEQNKVNNGIGVFEQIWVKAGGNISDILDSATQATKDLYSALSTSIQSGSKGGLESLLGSDVIKNLQEKNVNTALDKLSESIIAISKASQNSSDFSGMSSAIDKYLNLSDALEDVERNETTLRNMGLGDKEIQSLLYQLDLQKKINMEIQERTLLSDLVQSQQSDVSKEIKKVIHEIYKAGSYESVDQIVKDRYSKLISQFSENTGSLKLATREFTKQWLEGTVDGTFEQVKSGLNSNSSDLFESILDSMHEDSFAEIGSSIGKSLSDSILTSYKTNMLGKYNTQIKDINQRMLSTMDNAEGGSLSIMESAQISQRTQALAVQLESERQRMKAVESLFDYGRKIDYDQTANQINYKTSSSKESVYNITNTNQFNVGTVVSKDYEMRSFANTIAPFIEKAFRNLGVNLK